jgi:hypothetical protein
MPATVGLVNRTPTTDQRRKAAFEAERIAAGISTASGCFGNVVVRKDSPFAAYDGLRGRLSLRSRRATEDQLSINALRGRGAGAATNSPMTPA